MAMSRATLTRALVALVLLVAVGCSKVTRPNYDKVKTGMTESQVEAILGEGKEATSVGGAIGNLAGSAKVLTWGDENKSITVSFLNGKVVAKSQQGL